MEVINLIFDDKKYMDIFNLIMYGNSYREVSSLLSISKNTVSAVIDRLKSTGSIFPSTSRESKYSTVIREIQDKVIYYLQLRRNTYNKFKKLKLTNKEIHTLLLADNYDIKFSKTKELIKYGKNYLKENYLHIEHIPGDKVEFDWGTITIQFGGNQHSTRLSLAIFTLPYSNYRKVYISKDSSGQSFVKAFKNFTEELGGIAPNLILDNMRIAKIFFFFFDSEVKLTRLFKGLSDHYGFNVRFCTPHMPNQKGNVENAVKAIKSTLERSYINSFNDIEELEEYIDIEVNNLNNREHTTKNDSCYNLMKKEISSFIPLPEKEYLYYHEKTGKVNNRGYLTFKNNKYSVDEKFKGERVKIRYNDKLIYIVSMDEEVLAKYSVSNKKKKQKHRIWYMINKLRTKSNGFLMSEEYKSMDKFEKMLLDKVFKNNSSDFINFIDLIKHKPRNLIKKLVYKYKDKPDLVSIDTILLDPLLL